MDDISSIVQTVVTGLLAGGASAVTTVGASWKDFKKRLAALEEKVGHPGTSTEVRTGFFFVIHNLEESLRTQVNEVVDGHKKLRREVDGWSDDPPAWAQRLVRSRTGSSINLEIFQELEGRVDARIKSLNERVKHLEESLDEQTRRAKRGEYISEEEYKEDSRKRSEELAKIRENLSVTNGFLRGVMAAMGYIDNEEPPTSPGVARRK
jgi:hypothetical protein